LSVSVEFEKFPIDAALGDHDPEAQGWAHSACPQECDSRAGVDGILRGAEPQFGAWRHTEIIFNIEPS